MVGSELAKVDIERRVENWITRLDRLFDQIEGWRQNLPFKTSMLSGTILQRKEELMSKHGVTPKNVPTYTIIYKEKRLSFVPSGLWIIGANGRVNLTTNKKQYMIVDLAGKDNRPSRWVLVTPDSRQVHIDFNKTVFEKLLNE